MMLDTLKVLLHLDFNLAFKFEYFDINQIPKVLTSMLG